MTGLFMSVRQSASPDHGTITWIVKHCIKFTTRLMFNKPVDTINTAATLTKIKYIYLTVEKYGMNHR